jgi:hypothetical protein
MKPLFVYVLWSENQAFQNNSLHEFKTFETISKRVAHKVGTDNGYDKTKIKVLFDNGEQHEVRLDLCADGDTCYRDYVAQEIKYIGSEKFINTYSHDKQTFDMYTKYKQEFLLQINWD